MAWTKQQEKYLIDRYYLEDIEKIAEKLDKTRKAIMRKASRLGITNGSEKQKRDYRRRLLESCQITYNVDNSFGWFASGIIAGEGCFTGHTSTSGKKRYTFKIEMSIENHELLTKVRDYLGCGFVYSMPSRKEGWKPTVRYAVGSMRDIWTKLIPFFDTYDMSPAMKSDQYDIWKKSFKEYIGP